MDILFREKLSLCSLECQTTFTSYDGGDIKRYIRVRADIGKNWQKGDYDRHIDRAHVSLKVSSRMDLE